MSTPTTKKTGKRAVKSMTPPKPRSSIKKAEAISALLEDPNYKLQPVVVYKEDLDNLDKTLFVGEDDPDKVPLKLRPDYIKIKAEYIRGHFIVDKTTGERVHVKPTIKQLAEKHPVSYDTLRQRCSNEHWRDLRDAYLARVTEESLGEALSFYGETLIAADATAVAVAKDLTEALELFIEAKWTPVMESRRYARENKVPIDSETILENLNLTDLKFATGVLAEIYKITSSIAKNAPKPELDILNNAAGTKPAELIYDEDERSDMIEKLKQSLSIKVDKYETLDKL